MENLFHPFQPFILGQKALAPKVAAMYHIPLIFYGENEAEYGNPIKDNSSATRDWKYFTAEDKSKILIAGTSVADLKEYFGVEPEELKFYMPANPELIEEEHIEGKVGIPRFFPSLRLYRNRIGVFKQPLRDCLCAAGPDRAKKGGHKNEKHNEYGKSDPPRFCCDATTAHI